MTNMTQGDFALHGRVLTSTGLRPSTVVVSRGIIAAVEPAEAAVHSGAGSTALPIVRLADDEVLLPGLVDSHVHVNDPGRTAWEGFETATAAAAAGGVTSIVDMPLNSIPATTSVAALDVKRSTAAGQCAVDVGFWGGAVPASLGSLGELWDAGVAGFKCFLLDSGVPEFPALSSDQLAAAMTEIAAFDGLLIVHAEDPEVIADHACETTARYQEFLGSRPPEAETTAIAGVIDASRATGCRTHIVHLSSAAALPAIRRARADGVRLSVETCPHYLTLAAEDIADGQTQFKCCPPIRERANADLLWHALVDGDIDIVVSDHSPCTADLKLLDQGDFAAAWGGISSLQLGLPLVWTEARRRGISLDRVVGWMSAGPAQLVGLTSKGAIEVGRDADFAVFAPDQPFTVDARALRHRNPVTPYDGRELTGVVRTAYLRGTPLDPDQARSGRLLTGAHGR